MAKGLPWCLFCQEKPNCHFTGQWGLLDGLNIHGHAAVITLMEMGFIVYAKSRNKSNQSGQFKTFHNLGLLVFEDEVKEPIPSALGPGHFG
ncbi:hypothetical protein HQ520_18100 [bacterium]|nr:hypothetical protein [bacterium]